MAIAYRDTHELWVSATGFANVETKTPWIAAHESRIGSVTKPFTAAIVMQLVEEGILSLSDPLDRWAKGWPGWNGVTVRHLIGNTSGIVSYNYVGSFDKSRRWAPEELVRWAYDHGPTLRFAPGTDWEYSNTNFVLLGMIVEAATGRSYADTLRSRLFEPLGLATRLADSGDDSPTLVRCYSEPPHQDTSRAEDPTVGWAAGGIVSTPADLARWAVALYGGGVLRATSMELMTTPNGLTETNETPYGLATFIEEENGSERRLFGHTGGIAGYMAFAYYLVPEQVGLVVLSNRWRTNLRAASLHAWTAILGAQ
jgi:D-alanyl-D-alanine carboxypeptidase